jgi:hypothetical protein
VDVVREQVRANVPPAAAAFAITGRQLDLWVMPQQPPAAVYDLESADGPLLPHTPRGAPAAGWPPLEPARVLFGSVPLTWQRWVARWQTDGDGKGPTPLFSPAVKLLPGEAV